MLKAIFMRSRPKPKSTEKPQSMEKPKKEEKNARVTVEMYSKGKLTPEIRAILEGTYERFENRKKTPPP